MNKMRIFKLYISIYQEDTKDGQNLNFTLYFLHLSERIISKNFERAINFYYWHMAQIFEKCTAPTFIFLYF